jgi:hypothetical protein
MAEGLMVAGIAESARYGWRPEWDVEAAA